MSESLQLDLLTQILAHQKATAQILMTLSPNERQIDLPKLWDAALAIETRKVFEYLSSKYPDLM